MTIHGTLEIVDLTSFLHVLSSNFASGQLTLTRRERRATLILRDGRVVYAADSAPRETVGSILLHEGLISREVLDEALARQAISPRERRLGNVLLEMKAVDEATLEHAMDAQLGRILRDLLLWEEGDVVFESLSFAEDGSGADVLLGRTVPNADTIPEPNLEPPRPTVGLAMDGDISLVEVLSEQHSPVLTGEVTIGILRLAETLLARGAIFINSGTSVYGMGQFGFDTGSYDLGFDRVRQIQIPLAEPSVFREVIESGQDWVGPLEDIYWNRKLSARLGGRSPDEVVVLPIRIAGEIQLLFYGDNGATGRPLPDLEPVRTLMRDGGIALERSIPYAVSPSIHDDEPDGSAFIRHSTSTSDSDLFRMVAAHGSETDLDPRTRNRSTSDRREQ